MIFTSVKNFLFVNLFLVTLTTLNYHIFINYSYIWSLLSCFIRNYTLCKLIDYKVYDKFYISKKSDQSYNYDILIASFLESVEIPIIIKLFDIDRKFDYLIFVYFIPYSLIFEIIFDFFHYILHRLCHANTFLYINIHKHHHDCVHLKSEYTFHQNILDLILTNFLPFVLSLYIISIFNILDNSIYLVLLLTHYKIYTEICGHCGKETNNTTSFPQMMWVVKFLNIGLYVRDHDLHHKLLYCNYSKRFNIWDKVFGSFKN